MSRGGEFITEGSNNWSRVRGELWRYVGGGEFVVEGFPPE